MNLGKILPDSVRPDPFPALIAQIFGEEGARRRNLVTPISFPDIQAPLMPPGMTGPGA